MNVKDGAMSLVNNLFAAFSGCWGTKYSLEPNDGFVGFGFERGPFYIGGKFYKSDIDELIKGLEDFSKTL